MTEQYICRQAGTDVPLCKYGFHSSERNARRAGSEARFKADTFARSLLAISDRPLVIELEQYVAGRLHRRQVCQILHPTHERRCRQCGCTDRDCAGCIPVYCEKCGSETDRSVGLCESCHNAGHKTIGEVLA